MFTLTAFSVSGAIVSLLTSHNPSLQFCLSSVLILFCHVFTLSFLFPIQVTMVTNRCNTVLPLSSICLMSGVCTPLSLQKKIMKRKSSLKWKSGRVELHRWTSHDGGHLSPRASAAVFVPRSWIWKYKCWCCNSQNPPSQTIRHFFTAAVIKHTDSTSLDFLFKDSRVSVLHV